LFFIDKAFFFLLRYFFLCKYIFFSFCKEKIILQRKNILAARKKLFCHYQENIFLAPEKISDCESDLSNN